MNSRSSWVLYVSQKALDLQNGSSTTEYNQFHWFWYTNLEQKTILYIDKINQTLP